MREGLRVWPVLAWIWASPLAGQAVSGRAAADTAAVAYFDRAFEAIRGRALQRETIDWTALRADAMARLRGARTAAETYPAIELVLRRLGEGRGSLSTAQQAAELLARTTQSLPDDPEQLGRLMPARVGLLALPPFTPSNSTSATRFANLLRDRIAELEGGACGWMIDLRDTSGGDPWPMLAGVGPLLGSGVVGFTTDGAGRTSPWRYVTGIVTSGDSVVSTVFPPYQLGRAEPPIAVLTGPRTRGAGEAVLIALRGRSNTRSFGEATGGSPTSTATIPLSDGAILSLETGVLADRTGRTYRGSIAPDVTMAGGGDPANTQPIIAGTVWLNSTSECRRR